MSPAFRKYIVCIRDGHVLSSKKITILGSFFGLFLTDFLLFVLKILSVLSVHIQILSYASHPHMRINPHLHGHPSFVWSKHPPKGPSVEKLE